MILSLQDITPVMGMLLHCVNATSSAKDHNTSSTSAAQIVFDSVTAFFSVQCWASCKLYVPITAGAAAVILFSSADV